MENNILEIQNLTKYYGKIKGVENLSLKLEEGEIFGFIGPNGAGKSTTIRSIMNLINKTSGKVLVENKEFNKDDIEIKEKIGYLPSEIYLYDDLTVKEMLDYHESFYKKDIHKRRIELVKRLELDEKKKIEDLSLGNLKKLGIILAFMHEPKILILDEPTSGLDPIMQNVFYDLLKEEKAKGNTIFYSTHVLNEVSKICDRVGIILAFMHEPKILILDEPTSGLDPIMQNVFYDLLKEEKAKGNTIFYSTHILNEVSKICDRVGIIRNGKLIKVEKIEDLSKKSLTFVTITSEQSKEIVKDLKVNTVSEDGNTIKFGNNLSHDELIKRLSKYKIDRILIEEATLEDMFMHYYK